MLGSSEQAMDLRDMDTFFRHYLLCALWSSTDNANESGGDPLDDNYGIADFTPDAKAKLREDCVAFVDTNLTDLASIDAKQAGHDFWLTRNGHGAGFWDRGLGALGERLTKASKPYGSCDIVVGDDGMLHI